MVEKMDPLHVELSFKMLRLEQRMADAATVIGSRWHAIKIRRVLREVIKSRKRATLFLQAKIRFRIHMAQKR